MPTGQAGEINRLLTWTDGRHGELDWEEKYWSEHHEGHEHGATTFTFAIHVRHILHSTIACCMNYIYNPVQGESICWEYIQKGHRYHNKKSETFSLGAN